MILLIDRDILSSFCGALDVEWEMTERGSGILFSVSPAVDYVHCTWDADNHSGVRMEVDVDARESFLSLTNAALVSRHEALDRMKGKKREVMIDEITALVALRRLLRGK